MLRSDQRRGGGIAENGPCCSILRMDEFAVGFRCQQQDVLGLVGFDQTFCHRQSIDKAGTAEIKIECAAMVGDPQPVLQQAGSSRQKIIRRLGTQNDEVDCRAVDPILGKQFFGRTSRHIRRTFAGGSDVPFIDAGFFGDS